MSKLISIIIPVYNVQDYIEECLNSIVHQLSLNIEVIIVNDGSLDQSMKIVAQYLSELPEELRSCFHIINQINMGQSVARNNAIKIAKGRYIAFLDSDDYVSEDYLISIKDTINNFPDVDVISFNAMLFQDRTLKKVGNIGEKWQGGLHYGNQVFLSQVFEDCSWQVCIRVVRSDLIKQISFPVDTYLEDVYIFPLLYLRNIKIYHVSKQLYFYRQRGNSSVGVVNQKLINSYYNVIGYLESVFGSNKLVRLTLNKLYLNYYIHCFDTELFFVFLRNNLLSKNFWSFKIFSRFFIVIFSRKCSQVYRILKSER